MNRKFKIKKVDDDFVKVFWKLKNTIDRPFVWSEIKDAPLINDLGEPIGILNDFVLGTDSDKFEVILVFTVWKKYVISSFTDIEIVLLNNGKFEFSMI